MVQARKAGTRIDIPQLRCIRCERVGYVWEDSTHYECDYCGKEWPKEPSPIEKAQAIVNQRSEEKERMYGPFSEGMKKAAIIATELCNKELTGEDMYKILMALKLSRIAYHPGHDSLTDLIGYAEGLYNFKNNK